MHTHAGNRTHARTRAGSLVVVAPVVLLAARPGRLGVRLGRTGGAARLLARGRGGGGGGGVVVVAAAALAGDEKELVGEAADLLFHLLVLLDARAITLDQVLAELDRRDGTSGIAEKAAREP